MKLSKEVRKVSRELFKRSLVGGKTDTDLAKRIVSIVSESKPRHYLAILKNYVRLIRLEVEKRHAVIESAVEMDHEAMNRLVASLRGAHGQDLTTEFKVVPQIIGGLRIKIGSNVWDSTVLGRLNRLESQFAQI